MEKITVWTIGHSIRSIEDFIELLKINNIKTLVDVRHYPGSKREPQFNQQALKNSLEKEGIAYLHFIDLGGRRKAKPDSENKSWRSEPFRGYADYMETENFKRSIHKLVETASVNNTVYMCSEAVWWKCHRSMISDYLKSLGWEVLHIMNKKEPEEHTYTKPAKIINGNLTYK